MLRNYRTYHRLLEGMRLALCPTSLREWRWWDSTLFIFMGIPFIFMDYLKHIPGREVSTGNSMWAPTQPSRIPSPSDSPISHKAFTIQKSKIASDELGYSVSDSWLHSWESIPNCPLFSNAASFCSVSGGQELYSICHCCTVPSSAVLLWTSGAKDQGRPDQRTFCQESLSMHSNRKQLCRHVEGS